MVYLSLPLCGTRAPQAKRGRYGAKKTACELVSIEAHAKYSRLVWRGTDCLSTPEAQHESSHIRPKLEFIQFRPTLRVRV